MPAKPARKFTAQPAKRERVPLLIGLMGPSGGGKTFSALRLATGIVRATGGKIVVIDTEARRALHFADLFDFEHIQFDAPFGSLDYLDAIRYAGDRAQGGCVITDSMSHEHEGPGGMLDYHDVELDRMAGNDYAKREKMNMLAWQKPKAARRALINGVLQINANFIFCFRAKATAKPVRDPKTGKTEIVQQGYMPIAGEEFIFEQTVNLLLPPGAQGRPELAPTEVGERAMVKTPEQFKALLAAHRGPLDEELGEKMARWAAGGAKPTADRRAPEPERKTPSDSGQTPDELLVDLKSAFALAETAEEVDRIADEWRPVVEGWPRALIADAGRARVSRRAELASDDGKAAAE